MRITLLLIVGLGLFGVFAAVAMRVGKASQESEAIANTCNGGIGPRLAEPTPELLRILEKEKIVARVAAGELGLMDAVEQIRTLYDGEPTFLRGMRLKLPHASDTELCALNVISCVRAQLWNRPHEQAAQLERLQAEWEWFKESNQSAM